jgi:IS1 family transposase
MNRLPSEKRRAIVAALVEGNGINATCRMTGVSKNTVLKLLTDLGLVCSIYQDRMLRDLPCERIQADEIWSFCYAKAKNVPVEKQGEPGYGDVWTWVGMDADTKLVVSYLVGGRTVTEATAFMEDLASRLRNRVQLTTDGLHMYLKTVRDAFDRDVDYAQLIKTYGQAEPLRAGARYSPGVCTGIETQVVFGDPDPGHISTSYIERQNLTMRMSIRRFTRLTNAFSKKLENHVAAISLHFFHYNFVRVHKTLGTTPAVAAGVTDHVWTLPEMIGLLESAEQVPHRRGSYKKRSDSN